jgi:hypothetical protein
MHIVREMEPVMVAVVSNTATPWDEVIPEKIEEVLKE